jgi:hypothetical protein
VIIKKGVELVFGERSSCERKGKILMEKLVLMNVIVF